MTGRRPTRNSMKGTGDDFYANLSEEHYKYRFEE